MYGKGSVAYAVTIVFVGGVMCCISGCEQPGPPFKKGGFEGGYDAAGLFSCPYQQQQQQQPCECEEGEGEAEGEVTRMAVLLQPASADPSAERREHPAPPTQIAPLSRLWWGNTALPHAH